MVGGIDQYFGDDVGIVDSRGRLEAYLFRGNEYRITHAALEDFQDQKRNGSQYRT
jgi:hypothetical protein